jgi:hypothetical protein
MLSTAEVTAMIADLATLNTNTTDKERIDALTALERLKSAVAAAQARLTDEFAGSQRTTLVKNGANPGTPAGRCAPRSPWPDGTPRTRGADTSAWRTPWCTRCPAC